RKYWESVLMMRARIKDQKIKNTKPKQAKQPGGKEYQHLCGSADRFVRSPRNRDRVVEPRIGKTSRKKEAAARRGTPERAYTQASPTQPCVRQIPQILGNEINQVMRIRKMQTTPSKAKHKNHAESEKKHKLFCISSTCTGWFGIDGVGDPEREDMASS
ncbi:hypothetical protein IWZ03DRAFT_373792, partial [Phyllosticta citriasiana]